MTIHLGDEGEDSKYFQKQVLALFWRHGSTKGTWLNGEIFIEGGLLDWLILEVFNLGDSMILSGY